MNMNALLNTLAAGETITIGNSFQIYAYDDGTVVGRQQGSGLMSEAYPRTKRGLNAIFAWMDTLS